MKWLMSFGVVHVGSRSPKIASEGGTPRQSPHGRCRSDFGHCWISFKIRGESGRALRRNEGKGMDRRTSRK